MGEFTQAGRLMQFASPLLGPDDLLIQSFEGVEGLSRLFEFEVTLFGDSTQEILPAQIIGTKVTIAIQLLDTAGVRYINGFVSHFEEESWRDEFCWYRAHLVPEIWQLTLSTNCRVFQDQIPMDIIKAVLGPYGIAMVDNTKATYKTLDYCTQYNETDFNFISRIAEQFGIFYWFQHANGEHTIHFGDTRAPYTPCPLVSTVQFSPQEDDKEHLYHSIVQKMRATSTMVTGKHSARDYDHLAFKMNDSDPSGTEGPSGHPLGKNAMEDYVYPAGESPYVKLVTKALTVPAHGTLMLGARRDASDVSGNIFHGESTARTFVPGFTFTLTQHPRKAWNQSYLLTEVSHKGEQNPPYRSTHPKTEFPYTNSFFAIEDTRQFRPKAETPRPRIPGPQTAKVIGSSGEEIQVDKQGRVNVQFFWDRIRQPSTVDNTWVRVGQPWAGNGWGTFFWPRVGDEVMVSFLDGNPDAPIVIGSVYNGTNMPKYTLPDNSTRTGIVTRSSKSGSADTANELRFEDKKGSEQFFMNAEMDMDINVENDSRRHVEGKDSQWVHGDRLDQVDGDYNATLAKKKVEKIGSQWDLNVGTDLNSKIGSNLSLDVGSNIATKAGMNFTVDAGMEAYVKGGMTVVIESGMNLCLKGAGGFILIGPAGVMISGTMVMINSGGAAVPGTAGQLTAPGDPTAPDKADDGTKGGKM